MKTNDLHTELFTFTFYSLDGKIRDMENQIAIYALIDPRTKLPFYVGKTNDPKVRLKEHRTGRGITPTAKFIREIRAEGLRPEMEILELCSEMDWQDREAYWVADYQSRFGATQVLNVIDGGHQPGGFFVHSEATKERLRQMFKGRPIPQEQREQISKSLTGLKQSKETIEKRLATWAKRREEAGMRPLQRHETREEYLKSKHPAYYNEVRAQRRRERGQMVMGSEEHRQHQAEKQRTYYASLSDGQKRDLAEKHKLALDEARGKRTFRPMTPEERQAQSERLKKYIATLTPEQRQARMEKARAVRHPRMETSP